MSRFAIRLLTLAAFTLALVAPVVTSVYAAPDSSPPPPPPQSSNKKKKTSEVKPGSRGHRLRQRVSRCLRHDL